MKDYADHTDEELLESLRQGEQEVMDYLLDKYKFMVLQKARMLYLVGGSQDDLIQEGMIGLFNAVRDYRRDRDTSFYTFAQLCVDRQIYKAIKSSNRQKHQPLNSYVSLSSDEWESEYDSISQQSPENIVIAQENAAHLEETIRQQLSEFENQVLGLYLEGNDYLKIAEKLDKTPKSIDNALQRIRSKVRECLHMGNEQ
ncbi:MAG: sigma-70 family RNA polymerase sigma factor [Clostridia bacterium]|nr:sigma-70 family RNA polymerase sigma factor [Clostridia bacterium]NCC43374.1 sigma-70 family RNA polymerase sigma factor [Clostridia bacterium]